MNELDFIELCLKSSSYRLSVSVVSALGHKIKDIAIGGRTQAFYSYASIWPIGRGEGLVRVELFRDLSGGSCRRLPPLRYFFAVPGGVWHRRVK